MTLLRRTAAQVRRYPASTVALLLFPFLMFAALTGFSPDEPLQSASWTLALPLALWFLIRFLAEPRENQRWREMGLFPLMGFLAVSACMAYALIGFSLVMGLPSLVNEMVGHERLEGMTIKAKSDGHFRVRGCRYWLWIDGPGGLRVTDWCVTESAWLRARIGAQVTASIRYSALGYRVYDLEVTSVPR